MIKPDTLRGDNCRNVFVLLHTGRGATCCWFIPSFFVWSIFPQTHKGPHPAVCAYGGYYLFRWILIEMDFLYLGTASSVTLCRLYFAGAARRHVTSVNRVNLDES